jgi:hypothetical protein
MGGAENAPADYVGRHVCSNRLVKQLKKVDIFRRLNVMTDN